MEILLVDDHRSVVEGTKKLNVNSRVEAIKKAKGLGILPTEDLY